MIVLKLVVSLLAMALAGAAFPTLAEYPDKPVKIIARFSGAPEIPAMAESGVPAYEVSAWFGLLAPADTPKPVIDTRMGACKVRLRTLGHRVLSKPAHRALPRPM